jgi:hypothetical protein
MVKEETLHDILIRGGKIETGRKPAFTGDGDCGADRRRERFGSAKDDQR